MKCVIAGFAALLIAAPAMAQTEQNALVKQGFVPTKVEALKQSLEQLLNGGYSLN